MDNEPDGSVFALLRITLGEDITKKGFDERAGAWITKDRDCHVMFCCHYRNKHYHVPMACSDGEPDATETISRIAADSDGFIEHLIESFLATDAQTRMMLEVTSDDTLH